ncbi:hypothetical protein K402DRAFT_318148, partial [Aulographum hederae CBS 113979]
SQAQISWASQFEYGWWTAWIYAIVLAAFSAIFIYHLVIDREASSNARDKPSIPDKCAAAIRWFSYRRISGRVGDYLGLPSYGVLLLVVLALAASLIMSFVQHPYYRMFRAFGSPPLGVRTGLMAASLIPLIVALSGKVNMITMMTGIGHEKLNAFHRWIGWIMFILSLIHTFPFIRQQLHEGGYQKLRTQWNTPGSLEYNGTPAVALCFGLVAFSIPPIRRFAYEFFVYTHIAMAIVFFALCFWHFGNLGDSWYYLWATIGIWLVQLLGRAFWKTSSFKISGDWFDGYPTTPTVLSGRMMRLDVFVPSGWRWHPGQHVFLRFPQLNILENHPFTISSIANGSTRTAEEKSSRSQASVMSFYVRTQNGFTRKLLAKISSEPDTKLSTIIDGPYGTVVRPIERICEGVVLVAGGGGITAVLPWLLHLSERMSEQECGTKRVRLLWMVRDESSIEWVSEEMRTAFERVQRGMLEIDVYVTGQQKSKAQGDITASDGGAKEMGAQVKSISGYEGSGSSSLQGTAFISKHFGGRPRLADLMQSIIASGRTAVIGCGPESMKIDLSNAVAIAQTKVLRGESREIFLHTETFDW